VLEEATADILVKLGVGPGTGVGVGLGVDTAGGGVGVSQYAPKLVLQPGRSQNHVS
jgi:hypothetical protein